MASSVAGEGGAAAAAAAAGSPTSKSLSAAAGICVLAALAGPSAGTRQTPAGHRQQSECQGATSGSAPAEHLLLPELGTAE